MLTAKQQNAVSPTVSNLQKELKAATSCKELLKCHLLSSYMHSHWLSIPLRLCCEEGMGSILGAEGMVLESRLLRLPL